MKRFILSDKSSAKVKLQATSLWLVATIIVLMFTACNKKNERTEGSTQQQIHHADEYEGGPGDDYEALPPGFGYPYSAILDGDLSEFAGTWVDGFGTRSQLRADGVFSSGSMGDLMADGFSIYDYGAYVWNVRDTGGYGGFGVMVYPPGVPINLFYMDGGVRKIAETIETDTTKVRITAGQDGPSSSAEVYYREGEAPRAAVTVGAYKIGDTGPAGGIIFYDKGNDTNGWRYLEAALDFDMTSSHAWGYISNELGTLTVIGSGKENTRLMLAAGLAPAAQACANYRGGGKNDWFLPSKDELNEIYKQRNHFENTRFSFWSSSQGNEYNAWNQSFDNGNQEFNDNTNDFAYSVRPIRSFSSEETTAQFQAENDSSTGDLSGQWRFDSGGNVNFFGHEFITISPNGHIEIWGIRLGESYLSGGAYTKIGNETGWNIQ